MADLNLTFAAGSVNVATNFGNVACSSIVVILGEAGTSWRASSPVCSMVRFE